MQTWVSTKNVNKLGITQRVIERAILGLSLGDRETNKNARSKTKVKDVVPTMAEIKWRWAGHNERSNKKMEQPRTPLETISKKLLSS